MSDKLHLRGDTLEEWIKYNPIISDREVVLVATDLTNPKRYDAQKIGDGVTHFVDLPLLGAFGNVTTEVITKASYDEASKTDTTFYFIKD